MQNKKIFISLLLTTIAGAVAAAFAIAPLAVIMNSELSSLVITAAISLSLGFNAAIAVRDLKTTKRYHTLLNLSVVLSSLLVFFVLWFAINRLELQGLIRQHIKPFHVIGLGLVYSTCFLLPYSFFVSKNNKKTIKKQ